MNEQEFDREKRYQAAMQIADALLKKGAVSEKEYHQIKTILLEKYDFVYIIIGKTLDITGF